MNELDFLHALGSKQLAPAAKRALVRRLLDGGGAIDALTEAVCAGAESLVNAGASTGGELHEKFESTVPRDTHPASHPTSPPVQASCTRSSSRWATIRCSR